MTFLKTLAKKILKLEAKLILKKYKPKIIAITGSVGKTSTKEALYLCLAKKFFIRKSEKSFGTPLGVPLAIIGCSSGQGSVIKWLNNIFLGLKLLTIKSHYPDYLLLELDSDKPNDLKGISEWLEIDILVLTAIGERPSHIEAFSSLEEFLNEKRYIISALKNTGVIVYNSDDSITAGLLEGSNIKKIACGLNSNVEVSSPDYSTLYGKSNTGEIPSGMFFNIKYKDKDYGITIFDSIGIANQYACLLTFAVCIELGIDSKEIVSSLNKFKSLPGRMNIISGINNSIIIDDSYNASPIGLSQAINVLKNIKSGAKKIAVLGDMLELGRYSSEEHKKLVEFLKEDISNIICVGLRMSKVKDELVGRGFDVQNILFFNKAEEVVVELQKILKEGDIVLVKGSQAMRMEKVVGDIMRHPNDKGKLLVRQNPEWLNRG